MRPLLSFPVFPPSKWSHALQTCDRRSRTWCGRGEMPSRFPGDYVTLHTTQITHVSLVILYAPTNTFTLSTTSSSLQPSKLVFRSSPIGKRAVTLAKLSSCSRISIGRLGFAFFRSVYDVVNRSRSPLLPALTGDRVKRTSWSNVVDLSADANAFAAFPAFAAMVVLSCVDSRVQMTD